MQIKEGEDRLRLEQYHSFQLFCFMMIIKNKVFSLKNIKPLFYVIKLLIQLSSHTNYNVFFMF